MSVTDEVALAADDPATPVQPKPGPGDANVEYGVSQNMPFSIPYQDGNSVEVLREQGEEVGPTVRQLVSMRRTDGQARALYRLIALPIRSALKNSSFVAAEGGEKEQEFIEQMFTLPASAGGMTVPLHRVVAQLLMAVFDGFSAFEQVYWQPTIGPLKGQWTLKKLAFRPPETITFLADEHGGFSGLRQRTSFQGRTVDVKIDGPNSFYFACQEEERKFYGVSLFQAAFYHFDKKVKLYYVAHLAAQRAAVGTRKGRLPENASTKDKNAFIRSLADLGVAQYITLPGAADKWDVENLREGGTFDFLSYINHHNSQMSKSVLAAFFDSNQGGGKSDTSLVDFGQESDAMFLLMLQSIMDELAAAINAYLVPKFVDWNFGTGKYPKFQWGTFTDEQKQAIRETFDKLAVAGMALTTTKEFVFELEKKMAEEMGLEIDYDELEKEFEGNKARDQEAAEINHARLKDPTKDPSWAPPVPGGAPTPKSSGGSRIPARSAGKQPGRSGREAGAAKTKLTADQRDERIVDLTEELLAMAAAEQDEKNSGTESIPGDPEKLPDDGVKSIPGPSYPEDAADEES